MCVWKWEWWGKIQENKCTFVGACVCDREIESDRQTDRQTDREENILKFKKVNLKKKKKCINIKRGWKDKDKEVLKTEGQD